MYMELEKDSGKEPNLWANWIPGNVHLKDNEQHITIRIWAAAWQIQQHGLCAEWRLRSAWAFAQSDQSLHCPHEESLSS